ncbi:hypothetical protein GCM10010109_85270 [Actinoplanes campanulatus]|nr:hypothetical protein GCM10010109_85270 [Actinoplanes campanulatus]GID40494.1 hypothetical protein Aca09nite_70000 [Actinoplanes campanulatus]
MGRYVLLAVDSVVDLDAVEDSYYGNDPNRTFDPAPALRRVQAVAGWLAPTSRPAISTVQKWNDRHSRDTRSTQERAGSTVDVRNQGFRSSGHLSQRPIKTFLWVKSPQLCH